MPRTERAPIPSETAREWASYWARTERAPIPRETAREWASYWAGNARHFVARGREAQEEGLDVRPWARYARIACGWARHYRRLAAGVGPVKADILLEGGERRTVRAAEITPLPDETIPSPEGGQ